MIRKTDRKATKIILTFCKHFSPISDERKCKAANHTIGRYDDDVSVPLNDTFSEGKTDPSDALASDLAGNIRNLKCFY